MTYKDILRLGEGVHVVTVNTERCMVVRLRDGYTLTSFLPEKMMLIQCFSERGHLLWEERVEDIFSATEDTTQDNTQDRQEDNHEDIEVKDLVFVIEGLHGEKFHRVDLVFLCEYKGNIENAILQGDTNQVGYEWLDIKTLNTAPLYPSKLRRQIMNLYEGKEYCVYLGNEEIGDPEVTD